MHGLDIEEVRLAGKQRPEKVIRNEKTIRYPTEARSLQHAIDMCVAGDHISIMPGVYNESAVINIDLNLYREGERGEVCFVSRHDTALLVENCKVSLTDIGLCVEEGALMHHALHVDEGGEVTLEGCEVFGGLYACFACSESKIHAKQSRFHSALSFGVTLLNSSANFYDCFIFRNKEDGFNICGGTSKAYFSRSRLSDNKCHGMHVHTGAEVVLDLSEVLRNEQHGIAITGSDDQFQQRGEGNLKFSSVALKDSKVRGNEFNGLFILDGSVRIEDCDIRKNGRGAMTLASAKSKVQKEVDRLNLPFFDPEYYNTFEETGIVEMIGQIHGLKKDGRNEFTLPDRLPQGWAQFSKEKLIQLFIACPPEIQKKLHGHPKMWENPENYRGLDNDPQAAIKIKSELRTWIEAESGKQADSEIDQTVREFLQPLFEPNVVEDYMKKLQDIGCDRVRDMMSMTAFDLRNLGMKKVEDRKMVLSRLAANLEVGTAPKYIKEVPLNALVEATRYQAKSGDKKGTYKEWRKLREFFVERIGIGVSGPQLEKKLRDIYGEIDTENNAGSEGIDEDELRVGMQRFGINMANIDMELLLQEAIPEGASTLTFDTFCAIIQQVLRS